MPEKTDFTKSDTSQPIADVGLGLVIRTKSNHADPASAPDPASVEVLITRRRPGSVYGGAWEFPGGKADFGETIDDCVIRELDEEIGVRAIVIGALDPVVHAYDHGVVRLHPRLCRLAHGSPDPRPIQVADLRWSPAADLPRDDFPPANLRVIADLQRRLGALTAPAGREGESPEA